MILKKISTLIIKNPNQKENSRFTVTNIVYDIVNTLAYVSLLQLSSTAFKFHTQMLDFNLDYGIEFKLIAELDSIGFNRKYK